MALAVTVPILVLLVGGLWSSARSSVEQPGAMVAPTTLGMTRETCVDDKLRQQPKLYIHDMFRATNECELAIQSNEAYERRRQEWEARRANRQAESAATPTASSAPAAGTPAANTTGQRVWR